MAGSVNAKTFHEFIKDSPCNKRMQVTWTIHDLTIHECSQYYTSFSIVDTGASHTVVGKDVFFGGGRPGTVNIVSHLGDDFNRMPVDFVGIGGRVKERTDAIRGLDWKRGLD